MHTKVIYCTQVYSSEYKNGEDHRCSDLLKALAVEVSGPQYDFECRLKESKLHIGVELELFDVTHTENTIENQGKAKPFSVEHLFCVQPCCPLWYPKECLLHHGSFCSSLSGRT